MKVNSLQHELYHSGHYTPTCEQVGHSAGKSAERTRGYNVAFNGSGASSDTAVKVFKNLGKTFGDKILNSKAFQGLLKFAEEKSAVTQALVSLVVAGVLRPATNMAMASKDDREDAMYAASHAISSAIIGFIVSYTVMKPFDDAFKKFKAEPEKYIKEGMEKVFNVDKISGRRLALSNPYKNVTKVLQMIPDSIFLGIPKALLTIALIPPILKYVFGLEKKPKTAQQPQPQVQNAGGNK